MLLRMQFLALVAREIKQAGTSAGSSVFENRILPQKPDQLPAVTLSMPGEVKTSQGRGAPKFLTVPHMQIEARVTGPTAELAVAELDNLVEQIELATLANSNVVNVCQQFPSVETRVRVDGDAGSIIATATIIMQVEFYQTYDPATPDRLLRIQVSGSETGETPPALDIKF